MTKFKIGDKVKRFRNFSNYFGSYYKGKPFIIEKLDYDGSVLDPDGRCHDDWNLELFSVKKTHFPLYSEEAAVSLLKERGYDVTPPPEPLNGQLVIYKYKNGDKTVIYSKDRARWDNMSENYRNARIIIAIVDWTEGEGLPNKE